MPKFKATKESKKLLQSNQPKPKPVIIYSEDGEEKRYELTTQEFFQATQGIMPLELTDKLDAGKEISIVRLENIKLTNIL